MCHPLTSTYKPNVIRIGKKLFFGCMNGHQDRLFDPKRSKMSTALHETLSKLWSVTCHMGSQCYPPPDTGKCTPHFAGCKHVFNSHTFDLLFWTFY